MSSTERLWTTQLVLKDHGADVDLSQKYVVVEFQDTNPQSAVITLNAARGRFVTTGTIIEKWDRIWINVVDQNGIVAINSVVHVKSMEKMRPKGKGLQLKLFCPHQSSNIIKQTISKPNRRSSGNESMVDVVNQINSNLGANDPSVTIETPFNVTTKNGSRLSTLTANDYIFDAVKAQTAADEIVEREGNAVSGGGSFEFMYFRFVSKYDGGDEGDLDTVLLQVFEQGFMTSDGSDFENVAQITLTKPTLVSGTRANTLVLDSDLDTEAGTNLLAIGDRFSGTYPTDFSIYQGEKEFFGSARLWEEGNNYFVGHLVKFDSNPGGFVETYECIQENLSDAINQPTPGGNAFWFQRFFNIETLVPWQTGIGFNINDLTLHNRIGYRALQTHLSSSANEPPDTEFWTRIGYAPTVEYSPLTKGLSTGQDTVNGIQYWVNAMGGAQHAQTDNKRTAMITPDVVVRDTNHPRTWVDVFTRDPAFIPSSLLVDGDKVFDTFRCLAVNVTDDTTAVDAAEGLWAADSFGKGAGNDPNGVPYAGNIVEYRSPDGPGSPITIDGNGVWVVANLGPNGASVLGREQEIYDYFEGLSWINGPFDTFGFSAPEGTWIQGAYYLAGGLRKFTETTDQNNAIQFECHHNVAFGTTQVKMGNTLTQDRINNDDLDGNSAIFIEFTPNPFPPPGLIIPTRILGWNFAFPWPRSGISNIGGPVKIGEQIELEQFDLENMHLTHDRKREWFGPGVEEYFPIQGFNFEEKFFQDQNVYNIVGGLALRGDYPMGLWVLDRSDNIIIMDYMHFHNGQVERKTASLGQAKTYRAVPGFSTLIPAQNVELTDIFDKRSVVRGGIFTRESYDTQNRYSNDNKLKDSTNLKLIMDSFRMTKPLTATNVEEPNSKPIRNIEPQKLQWEKVVSYAQLKNMVLAKSQVLGFRIDRYGIETPGRGNIAFGDPVNYFDPEAISTTLTDASGTFPNTVRATATRITYSLSKSPDGPGGFTRQIDLATRLYPV